MGCIQDKKAGFRQAVQVSLTFLPCLVPGLALFGFCFAKLYVCAGGQERSPELELEPVVSHLKELLGTILRSSKRAICSLVLSRLASPLCQMSLCLPSFRPLFCKHEKGSCGDAASVKVQLRPSQSVHWSTCSASSPRLLFCLASLQVQPKMRHTHALFLRGWG